MKKGFTLVELLAVIVILAVILVIAVPQINNVIKETKKNSLSSTAKIIAAKAEEATVENEILENNEALSCANLVKLDDNYGSCTVSMVNGKGTVTIVGTGKFAGITCTGTKDNMSCTEGSSPQYVYSFGEPYNENAKYVVIDSDACETYLNDIMVNNWGYMEEDAQSEAEVICSNSDDIYNNPNDPWSTNDWFSNEFRNDGITYEEVNSFLADLNITTDYTTLKYPGTNTQAQVFVRWNADEEELSERNICILYGGNLTCLEAKSDAFETNKSKIEALFGSDNCYRTEGYISCGDRSTPYSNNWLCDAQTNGYVGCQAPGYSCATAMQGLCAPGELD